MMAWLLLQDTRDNAGRWKDKQHCLEGFIPTVPSYSLLACRAQYIPTNPCPTFQATLAQGELLSCAEDPEPPRNSCICSLYRNRPASPLLLYQLPALTLRGGLRPAGPGCSRATLPLLQGGPDAVLQAAGLLLEQTCPYPPVSHSTASFLGPQRLGAGTGPGM